MWILWVIVGAVAACFVGLLYCYFAAFFSPQHGEQNPYRLPPGRQYKACREEMNTLAGQLAALPFEPVEIRSYDGLRLYGRYYETAPGAPLQIQFHGYRGIALRDFCGGALLARKLGHNLLLVDQRAHGRSGGHTICFGIKEQRDCQSWVAYAARRFGENTPIFLVGVSMGAATVLMAAALPLAGRVVGVLADSPYTAPRAIIQSVCAHRFSRRLAPAATAAVGWAARLFGRFSIDAASPLQAVAAARVPVLLLHGEDDRFVPCEMSRELYAACTAQKRLVTFAGAGHGLGYLADPAGYEAAVGDFIASCLA